MKRVSIDEKCRVPVVPAFGKRRVNSFAKSTSKIVYEDNCHNVKIPGRGENDGHMQS
jgi:hypothetical protein